MLVTMRDHNTKCTNETARFATAAKKDVTNDDFDPARVFADPVAYLAGFGLRSELAEPQPSGLPAAA